MAHLPKGQGIIPMPPFMSWLSNNIPAVYDNTMSYYEELCSLIKYLQDIVVPAVNHNAEALTVVSNALDQLKQYVDNYFDNLDVQEEINNKLDQMAEDGTLQEIIAAYIQANVAWTFDNVTDMKSATNLVDGSFAQTFGFYSVNDEGGAKYKIRNITNDDVVDEITIISLSDDNLIAELIIDNTINAKCFGVKDDLTFNNTIYLQKAIDTMYAKGLDLIIPTGTYKTNSLILKCNIIGNGEPTILFNNGQHFTNFEIDGSKRYDLKKIEGISFESDKSSYWNDSDAGESFNPSVTEPSVIRTYGQRVYIGNKTTTPNNIHSTDNTETINGTGYPFNYYAQWTDATDLNLDSITTTYANIDDKEDTNIITSPLGVIIERCKFKGFSVGLTFKGVYNSTIVNTYFERCKIGVVCDDGSTLPGSLQDSNAKITTILFDKNTFKDIKFFGIYGRYLLQSNITNNIFQPVNVSIVLVNSADNNISENYNEIVYCSTFLASNNAFRNNVSRNFTNNTYSTYNVYLRYGVNNEFGEPLNNVGGYVAASTENNNFSEKFNLTKTSYFYTNGNAINRNKTKYAVFTTTGTGSSFTTEIKKTSRVDGTMPSITVSGPGIYFNGTEEILSIEVLNGGSNVLRYYDVAGTGNPNVAYINKWNTSSFEEIDLRTNALKNSFRVAFNDGYKAS